MSFEEDGYQIFRSVITETDLVRLRAVVTTSGAAGNRKIAAIPEVRALVDSSALRVLLPDEGLELVRSLLFDKTPESNWPVLWHQDRTIAVTEYHPVENGTVLSRVREISFSFS